LTQAVGLGFVISPLWGSKTAAAFARLGFVRSHPIRSAQGGLLGLKGHGGLCPAGLRPPDASFPIETPRATLALGGRGEYDT